MRSPATFQMTTPTDREIVMTRVFEASARLLFDAWTKPELLKRWLGVHGDWTMPICEIDLRVGGAYRIVWRGTGGAEMVMRGVYREIVPPERLVQTESFDDPWYPGECLDTVVLVEQGGRTTMTFTNLYESREARDIALKSGMDEGVVAAFDTLAELLRSMA
jgi:uncharacterized protein YndB with AHSA1/START domain